MWRPRCCVSVRAGVSASVGMGVGVGVGARCEVRGARSVPRVQIISTRG